MCWYDPVVGAREVQELTATEVRNWLLIMNGAKHCIEAGPLRVTVSVHVRFTNC